MGALDRVIIIAVAGLAAGCGGGNDSTPPAPPAEPRAFPQALRGGSFSAMAIDYTGGTQTATATVASSGLTFQLRIDGLFDETLALPLSDSTSSGKLTRYPLENDLLSNLSFGEWNSSAKQDSASPNGFFAFGTLAPGPNIPTSGLGFYGAVWIGYMRSLDGANQGPTRGVISSKVDFASRSVDVAIGDPFALPIFGATLSYQLATNSLTGTTTRFGVPNGTIEARFFGPAAKELGGTFTIPATPTSPGVSGTFGMFNNN